MQSVELRELVRLSAGFKTAVAVRDDLDNLVKAGGYLPTDAGQKVIFDVTPGLHPASSQRARLVTGTYGTGKSHVALVLAELYRLLYTRPEMAQLWERLSAHWPGQAQKLRDELERQPKPYLLVILEGNEGDFNKALLSRLRQAIKTQAGEADVLPETVFSAAVKRIEELKERYPENYQALDSALEELGLHGADVVRRRLGDFDRDVYEQFCRAHEMACAGAQFHPDQMMLPSEVYSRVSAQLRREGLFSGIVVIWDEFGRYMERLADDPIGGESRDIERFAEACQVPQNCLHLYLVCHRALEEYAQISRIRRGIGDDQQIAEDMRKTMGRFAHSPMHSSEEEVFQLIDQVLNQAAGGTAWLDVMRAKGDDFDDLAEEAEEHGLFRTLSREQIRKTVAVGSFPLHPMSAFALPRLSEMVAQNERTMFTYLSDSGPGSIGEFISEHRVELKKPGLPLVCLDHLWDYFQGQVESNELRKRVHVGYRSAASRLPAKARLGARILKAVAVFEVIESDRVRPTAEVLRYALDIAEETEDSFQRELEALSQGDDRVLVRSVADGSYRFPKDLGSHKSLEDKVRDLVKERSSYVDPITHLNGLWSGLDLPVEIPATGYTDDRHVPRALVLKAVSPAELDKSHWWTRDLGDGDFRDGYALLVIGEDSRQITKARDLALGVTHPQVLVGVPKEPVKRCLGNLRRHEALLHLADAEPKLYGKGGEYREEWEATVEEYARLLRQQFEPLVRGVGGRLNSVAWFWKGEGRDEVTTASRLTALATRMMETVFRLTPTIPHDVLADGKQRDTFKKHRVPVIDMLFDVDGPERLAANGVKVQRTVSNALLTQNGILRTVSGRHVIARPDAKDYPAMAAVWDKIAEYLERCKEKDRDLSELVLSLRRPPFGLPVRCMSVLFAGVACEQVRTGNIVLQWQRTKTISERITKLNGAKLDDAFAGYAEYRVGYLELSDTQRVLLRGLAEGMGLKEPDSQQVAEMVSEVADGVKKWWLGLPRHAQITGSPGKDATVVKREIIEPLVSPDGDVHEVLLQKLPSIVRGGGDEDAEIRPEAVTELFSSVREDFEQAVKRCTDKLSAAVSALFSVGRGKQRGAQEALSDWYQALDTWKHTYAFPGDAGKLMTVARQPGDDVVDRLAQTIMGAPITEWADNVTDQFEGRLQGAKELAEMLPPPGPDTPPPPPPPPARHTHLLIRMPDGVAEKTFLTKDELSPNGLNLDKLLRSALDGIAPTLPDGEALTVLARLIRDALDRY